VAKSSGGIEYEHHIVGVRQRINGSGHLLMSLESYQAVNTFTMLSLPLLTSTPNEPMRTSNFQSQRVRYVGKVTTIDDNFQIGRIIIYAKPVSVEYPQTT